MILDYYAHATFNSVKADMERLNAITELVCCLVVKLILTTPLLLLKATLYQDIRTSHQKWNDEETCKYGLSRHLQNYRKIIQNLYIINYKKTR